MKIENFEVENSMAKTNFRRLKFDGENIIFQRQKFRRLIFNFDGENSMVKILFFDGENSTVKIPLFAVEKYYFRCQKRKFAV